ncbi:hypothetical protein BDF20DRAFT_880670 [Mycotypha africana]|uniref:uncharacterized protein n=1 Tax=Mycotypha africana TaxID=64632 RepID=UPI0023010A42|nr:uncharacterized protein BDF20DRAFT_880670 [Mycotypha africana]KAI8975781.1 hypothetical protein BDF20DRAFT_880670 [Mycotypha africana]
MKQYGLIEYFFFLIIERNKTERKLKQAKRKLEEAVDEDSKRAIDEEIQELEIRLLYITHHPRTADYVSLYPKSNENDPKSQKKREKLLNDIKQALKDGDKDLVQLNKRYRENYKEQLIKRGILQPVTPVDIENLDTSATKTGDVEVHEGDTENNDDFFEM